VTDRPLRAEDRVRNPRAPEWGLGRVLLVEGDTARIFFRNAGEKRLSLRHVNIEVVDGEAARDPVLDLPLSPGRRKRLAVRDFDSLVSDFLKRFPLGFRDPQYLAQERRYKVEASELCAALLGEADLVALIESGREDEVASRAIKVLQATNLVFPNEKMDLKDGLRERSTVEVFARSLNGLLYGTGDLSARFDTFADLLHRIGAAKWTTATYYPFLRFPGAFMFLKPQVTVAAADRCGFDIAYRPRLNWLTYRRVTDFAEHLRGRISDLQPQDMIDVQSFIWVCGGERG
jgi:hypothetical protein